MEAVKEQGMVDVTEDSRVIELIHGSRNVSMPAHRLKKTILSHYLLDENSQSVRERASKIETWELYNAFDGKQRGIIIPINCDYERINNSVDTLLQFGFSCMKVGGYYVSNRKDVIDKFLDRLKCEDSASLFGNFAVEEPKFDKAEERCEWVRRPEVAQASTDIIIDSRVYFGQGYPLEMKELAVSCG